MEAQGWLSRSSGERRDCGVGIVQMAWRDVTKAAHPGVAGVEARLMQMVRPSCRVAGSSAMGYRSVHHGGLVPQMRRRSRDPCCELGRRAVGLG